MATVISSPSATATTSSAVSVPSALGPSAPTPMATIDSPRQMITNRL